MLDVSEHYDTYDNLKKNIPDIDRQLMKMWKTCFRKNIPIPKDNMFLTSKINDTILAVATVNISDPTSYSIWNVCSTALGKNMNAIRSLLEYGLPFLQDRNIWLILEFENPYWDKAVNLYTSLGFRLLSTVDTGLKMEYTLDRDVYDARDEANELRQQAFPRELQRIVFLRDKIYDFASQIVTHNKEYCGYLLVTHDLLVGGLGNLTGGNLILPDVTNFPASSEIYSEGQNYIFTFHTHPIITTVNNGLPINPPSDMDVAHLLANCSHEYLRQYIFTPDGLFALGLSKYMQDTYCNKFIPLEKINEIRERYQSLVDQVLRVNLDDIFGIHVSKSIAKGVMTDLFIESVLDLEYEGMPMFDLKFWPLEYIRTKESFVDTFFISYGLLEQMIDFGSFRSYVELPLTSYQWDIIYAMEVGESAHANKKIAQNVAECKYIMEKENLNVFRLKSCFPYSFIDLNPVLNISESYRAELLPLLEKGVPYISIITFADISEQDIQAIEEESEAMYITWAQSIKEPSFPKLKESSLYNSGLKLKTSLEKSSSKRIPIPDDQAWEDELDLALEML